MIGINEANYDTLDAADLQNIESATGLNFTCSFGHVDGVRGGDRLEDISLPDEQTHEYWKE